MDDGLRRNGTPEEGFVDDGGTRARKRVVVVAVDDSESSQVAFRWVLRNLVAPKSDHLVLLNSAPFVGVMAFPNPDIASEYIVPPTASLENSETAEKMVTEESKALVTKYMEECQEAGISCEGEVVKGEPGSWIVDETKRLQADVVAVGSHDSGVIKRTLLGSVSDYVLHNAHCPVVIVRPIEALIRNYSENLPSGRSRKIVVAVDGSKESIDALAWSLQNVCADGDKVVIYHVHHSVSPSVTSVGTGAFGMEEVFVPPEKSDEIEVQALTDSQKLVEKYMAYVSQRSKVSCEGMVVTGQTDAKVCAGLTALQADLVVVGAHEKGALARTFLGSVSDYLAHSSPCPLIVVKQKLADREDMNSGHDQHTHVL